MPTGIRLQPQEQKEMSQAYANGESAKIIATRYGINEGTVIKAARAFKVSIRSRSEYPYERSATAHAINEHFFSVTPTSEEQAYLLGFISAYGHCSAARL